MQEGREESGAVLFGEHRDEPVQDVVGGVRTSGSQPGLHARQHRLQPQTVLPQVVPVGPRPASAASRLRSQRCTAADAA